MQANQSNSSLPHYISLILQNYNNVLLKGLPSGFPPIQGIEHQIDFVLGLEWPNKVAYRCNSVDIKELKKNV